MTDELDARVRRFLDVEADPLLTHQLYDLAFALAADREKLRADCLEREKQQNAMRFLLAAERNDLRQRLQEAEVEAVVPEELRDLFARMKAAEKTATWGGSFEREDGARRQAGELAKQLWDATIKWLAALAAQPSQPADAQKGKVNG